MPADTTTAPMLTVEQVARRLGMSDSFVYDAIHDGRLRHNRFGKGQGGIRVSEEQLAAFLKATEHGGGAVIPPPPGKEKYRHLGRTG